MQTGMTTRNMMPNMRRGGKKILLKKEMGGVLFGGGGGGGGIGGGGGGGGIWCLIVLRSAWIHYGRICRNAEL